MTMKLRSSFDGTRDVFQALHHLEKSQILSLRNKKIDLSCLSENPGGIFASSMMLPHKFDTQISKIANFIASEEAA